jgi:Zn-dependent peptidase ImmA (M78 family)
MVWARETAGLSQQEAAGKLGFKDSRNSDAVDKLAALEFGVKEPTRPQIVKMADVYRRPLLTFYLSKPPVKGDRGVDFRTLPAEYSAVDDALLDALVRDITARQSMVRAVLEDEEEAEPLAFANSHRMEDGSLAILASLRAVLNVELRAYRSMPNAAAAFAMLRESAENAGIFVLIKGDLGNYRSAIDINIFRGFSIADPVAPFIVINDQDARLAWSFTLLHETVHILLGQTGVGAADAEDEVERFCDQVAGEFLLPEGELARLNLHDNDELSEISDQIGRFANEANLSRTMVAYKAFRSNMISRDTYGQLSEIYRQQWRAERERTRTQARENEGGPSFYMVRRHKLGGRITTLVHRMMAAGALSTSKAARILGVKSRQVQPLLDPIRAS